MPRGIRCLAEKSSLFRSLSGSLSLAGSQVKGLAQSLTGSLGSASSLAEKSSLFRSLSGSLSLAGSLFRGRVLVLSASFGSTSSLAERSSIFRSLVLPRRVRCLGLCLVLCRLLVLRLRVLPSL